VYEREGAHFFDVGAGELIANGTVKVRSKVSPVAYTETGLLLSDGTCVHADVIVFATGYEGNMKHAATKIFGSEIGDNLQESWQCDEEGELRAAYKHTGRVFSAKAFGTALTRSDSRIWYTGYSFAHARFYSRFIALQVKADVSGRPFDAYNETIEV
jgi:hypothetical protein